VTAVAGSIRETDDQLWSEVERWRAVTFPLETKAAGLGLTDAEEAEYRSAMLREAEASRVWLDHYMQHEDVLLPF
jgi:hypothetical protein